MFISNIVFLCMLVEGDKLKREARNLRRRWNMLASVLSVALQYYCFLVLADGVQKFNTKL